MVYLCFKVDLDSRFPFFFLFQQHTKQMVDARSECKAIETNVTRAKDCTKRGPFPFENLRTLYSFE